MKDFIIEGSNLKPAVHFKSIEGILNISGRSLPEYAEDIFDPMNKWLEEYMKNPKKETVFNISLEYFNSSSAKAIVRFLNLARNLRGKNQLVVNYYYDDENIYEYGKDFSELIEIPFNFIEKKYY